MARKKTAAPHMKRNLKEKSHMDPNAALTSILRGHMIADHAEALHNWLAGGGFAPAEQLMPADKHEFFAVHCERQHGDARGVAVRVKADVWGIWTTVTGDDWYLVARYWQIMMFKDSEY